VADFKTHLIGAALISGVSSTALISADAVSSDAAMGYFFAGVAGGILPDVDLGHSVPVKIARRLITVLGVLLVVLRLANIYSLLEIAVVGVGMYYSIHFCFEIFDKYTVHRGLVHSLPSAAIAGLGSGVLAARFLGSSATQAWFYSLFVFVGFMVHLALDEMYSVNLLGASFKRSFGTAITLGDKKNMAGTTALYFILLVLIFISPAHEQFVSIMGDDDTYTKIFEHIWPNGNWFESL